MMPAAKHLDPVLGIDVHIVQPPGPVPPVPIPHPYVGMIFDPGDYLPLFGATVKVNGLPRAQAGTSGQALPPHIPIGGVFVKPPSNESEMFMGSATVAWDGDAASYLGLPVLSCQDIGMPAPFRKKKKNKAKSLMLPTSVVLPIPAGPLVLIGGPPTISLSNIGGKVAMAGLGKTFKKLRKIQKKSRRMRALSQRIHGATDKVLRKLHVGEQGRNRVHRAICTVTGHPVDVATGKLFTEFVDVELPGPIPFKFERVWYSTSCDVDSPVGRGWHHSYDMGLIATTESVVISLADGRAVAFPHLEPGNECFDRKEGLTLIRDEEGYAIRTRDVLLYRFTRVHPHPSEPHMLSSIQNLNGARVELSYDKGGNLTSIRDSAGRKIEFRLDGAGRIVEILVPHPTDAHARLLVRRFVYDQAGHLVEVRDALGRAWHFEYRGDLLVKESDRNGVTFFFEFDGVDRNARCTRTWGRNPQSGEEGLYDVSLVYDVASKKTIATNGAGYETTYKYNEFGVVVEEIGPDGASTTRGFDELYCEKIQETDALGRTTQWGYDDRGNTAEIIGPDGATVSFLYNDLNLPIEVTDPNGHVWRWEYDARGNLLKRHAPEVEVPWTYRYDARGRIIEQSSAGLGPTRYAYDEKGNVNKIIEANGAETHLTYDQLGRVIQVCDPMGTKVQVQYDSESRLTERRFPLGLLERISYDREGNVSEVRTATRHTKYRWGGFYSLIAETDVPTGDTVRYKYDGEGTLLSVTNEASREHVLEYDPSGRLISETTFDGEKCTYIRDEAGQVIQRLGDEGKISKYRYDPAGRLIDEINADGSTIQYGYRADGAMTRAFRVERDGAKYQTELVRNAMGQLVHESSGEGERGQLVNVEIQSNPTGSMVRRTTSLGGNVHVDRDAIGSASRIAWGKDKQTTFKRDLRGNEIERTLVGGALRSQKFDMLGRVTEHRLTLGGGGQPTVSRSYHWRSFDQLAKVEEMLGDVQSATQYTHDSRSRLIQADRINPRSTAIQYRSMDAAGHIFPSGKPGIGRTYSPSGKLLEDGKGTRYRYDTLGRLVEKTLSDGARWHYRWSDAGDLLEVEKPDNTRVSFHYDAFSRRIQKTHVRIDGEQRILLKDVRYIWSGSTLLHEVHRTHVSEAETTTSTISWHYEPDTLNPLAKEVRHGDNIQHFSIITDINGTPTEMVDDAGRLAWKAQLDLYGVPEMQVGERSQCPFRFSGQYEDEETGLYYNRFRYYDPGAGQYISRDPIGLRGGIATYGYVKDPTTWVDPLGLAGCSASERLPRMQGMSVDEAEKTLQRNGFSRTHVSSSPGRNQKWSHPDGSEVRIHPYGNQNTHPVYRSANNAHIHKEDPIGNQLTDRGIASTDPSQTHIGIRNPTDLPAVRGRPHGAPI